LDSSKLKVIVGLLGCIEKVMFMDAIILILFSLIEKRWGKLNGISSFNVCHVWPPAGSCG